MEEPRKRTKKSKTNSKHKSSSTSTHSADRSVASSDENDEVRRAKLIKSAAKHAQKMAELGLDMNGEPLDNYSLAKYPVREWKLHLPGFQGHIVLNPVVNLIGIVCLWAFVAWVAFDPTGSMKGLTHWHEQISFKIAWLLQLSTAVTFFFLLFIMGKYGHIRLGRPGEKPEFSFVATLALLLAAGGGPGMIIFSAVGPSANRFGNFFGQPGYRSQDEVDMFAINTSVFEWGILLWTRFALVAVAVSLAGHRFGLPLTIRSCFYPMLGAYTWGWIGDVIDGVAVVTVVAGSALVMCYAIVQIVICFAYLGWMDRESSADDVKMMQNLSIWVATILSTASVISGLRGGIRFFSRAAIGLCTLLVFVIFIMDDTKFLLNLQVQEVGYHLQTSLFQLNFWTDAFGQLRPGSGRAIDGGAADESWYRTTFALYHSASISVGCGVGMLAAHLCRGRTLGELIVLSLIAPILYYLVWFCTWGGIGLRQARQAAELQALGADYYNNSAHFLSDSSQVCYDVPQQDVVVANATIFTNYLPGVTPVCQFDFADFNTFALNMLSSFSYNGTYGSRGLGPFLVTMFVLACVLLLIASSDSCSLMVDSLTSNARRNYHWMRRLFWAGTVGAVSMSLLCIAGMRSLKAVESFVLICTVPMLLAMCFMLQSIVLFCNAACDQMKSGDEDCETDYRFPDQPEFVMPIYGGILNSVEYVVSLGKVNPARVQLGMHRATALHGVEFVKGLVVPFLSLNQVLHAVYPQNRKTNAIVTVLYALCYLAWLGCLVAARSHPGLNGVMCAFLVGTSAILGSVRSSFRSHYNLRSNAFADFVGSLFFWPQVLTQMRVQCVVATTPSLEERDDQSIEKRRNRDDKDSGAGLILGEAYENGNQGVAHRDAECSDDEYA